MSGIPAPTESTPLAATSPAGDTAPAEGDAFIEIDQNLVDEGTFEEHL